MYNTVVAVSREHGQIEFNQIPTVTKDTIAVQATGAFGSIVVSEIAALNQRIWHSQFLIEEDLHLSLTLREEVPSLRLIFNLKDDMTFFMNSRKSVRRRQQYDLLYNPESSIEYVFKKGKEYSAVVIFMKYGWLSDWGKSVPDLTGILAHVAAQKPVLITKTATAHMRDIVLELISNRTRRTIFTEAKVLELLNMVVSQVTDSHETNTLQFSEADIEKIQKARDYLQDNIGQNITIISLAKVVALSDYKLKHGFKHLFEITIHHFVLQERMRLATKLLTESKLSMKEIAKVVGYRSYPHFCSSFKKNVGYSGSSVRKSRSA